jgi:hypothetical protein
MQKMAPEIPRWKYPVENTPLEIPRWKYPVGNNWKCPILHTGYWQPSACFFLFLGPGCWMLDAPHIVSDLPRRWFPV